jgi:hypothetical protein
MKRILHHPWWTHIPSLGLLGVIIYAYQRFQPLPANVPTHFAWDGHADGWGSPLSMQLVILLLSVLWIGIGVAIDETWARREQRKTFNWMSLFDEVTIAFMAGMFCTTTRWWRQVAR